MLKRLWDCSVGGWLYESKRRDERRRSDGYYYHMNKQQPLPRADCGKLTSYQSKQPEVSDHHPLQSCSPLDSRLLHLPAEIRLLIWEHAIGGSLVALYRTQNRRLSHIVLDDTNSWIPGENIPVQAHTIKIAVVQLAGSKRNRDGHPPHSVKLDALAVLRSWRSM
jgi:hypothetical protein